MKILRAFCDSGINACDVEGGELPDHPEVEEFVPRIEYNKMRNALINLTRCIDIVGAGAVEEMAGCDGLSDAFSEAMKLVTANQAGVKK